MATSCPLPQAAESPRVPVMLVASAQRREKRPAIQFGKLELVFNLVIKATVTAALLAVAGIYLGAVFLRFG